MSLFSINFNWFTNFTTDEVDAILTCEILIKIPTYIMVSFMSKIVLGKVHLIWQGGGMKILRGGLPKFLDTRKGSSEKIRGGGLRKFVYF